MMRARGTVDVRSIVLRALLLAGLALLLALMAGVGARDARGPDVREPGKAWVLAVGRIMGLWAVTLLLLQPIAALRVKTMELAFSLDRLFKYHRLSGVVCLSMAFLHPMAIYGSKLRAAGPSGLNLWPEGLGLLALVGLWLLVVSSAYRGFLLLRWELWRKMHYAAGPVIGLALVHLFFVQPDVHQGGLALLWAVLLGVWVSVVVFLKRVRPRLGAGRGRFKVTDVRTVARGICEVTLVPIRNERVFSYQSGQFAFVRFRSTDVASEEHPFTLASTPADQGYVQFAIKGSGDFTRTIPNLKAGDQAMVSGPHGGFTPDRFGDVQRLVMVAGGIGVTPMLSVLRTLDRTRQPLAVTLIWSNRTIEDIPYQEELVQMQKEWPEIHVHLVLTQGQPSSSGIHCGRLDESAVRELAPRYESGTHVMLCGPGPMMRDLAGIFRRIGYPRRSVHYEAFSL